MGNILDFTAKVFKVAAWFSGFGGKRDERKAKRKNKKNAKKN